MKRRKVDIQQNWIDRAVTYINPKAGLDRLRARHQAAVATAYVGASRDRKATKNWKPFGGDADTDILPELEDLRERSRDLIRNAPIATGAINTKVTNIVGSGLTLHCRIDRDFLGLSEDQADEWEKTTKREFEMWASSQDCSADRQSNFFDLQALVFRSTLENGDIFALLPRISRKGTAYKLAIRLIEADRVSNKNRVQDTQSLAGGIVRDPSGAPTHVQIQRVHPGNRRAIKAEWDQVPIFGSRSGRRNVLHIYRQLRVGQVRGVPDLAPVIETLKQLDRYTEAEITAAVVSGMFTVFVESTDGLDPLDQDGQGTRSDDSNEVQMGSGAIVDLAPNEKVEFADPGRPNSGFDPFVMSILRQIGVALEIPLELLILHFTASYSASRAALEQAWKFFKARRKWLSGRFCDPVYEAFLTEAVQLGRISAPGFLNGDPAIRAAYLRCEWNGPAKGHIQPLQEIKAEEVAVGLGTKTLDEVTAETTGGDWESKHRQRAKEVRMRKADGLSGTTATVESTNSQDELETNDDPDEIDREENDE